ncbi:MAG: arsenite methyltransferase [Verrucomicrobia bacterium]|nr:arsenite methyltransferase [Verrucomicrobiota bacterium]
MQTQEMDSVRTSVREHYGKIAVRGGGCGCMPTCCDSSKSAQQRSAATLSRTLGYSTEDVRNVPDGANLGLGCGNPVAIASLRPGQTVLDLGSGAGFDALLAAKAVGPAGRVIGVDMTAEMISKARQNKAKGGYTNVEFRLGEIENLPVADGSVDVILSNCVINLSPDKAKAYREAFRALKPGGRLTISDIVVLQPLPESVRQEVERYTPCGGGAALVGDLKNMLREAGFQNIRVEPIAESRELICEYFPGRGLENYFASATIEAVKPDAA